MLVRCDVRMVGTSQLVCSERRGGEIWGLTGKPGRNSFNKSGVFFGTQLVDSSVGPAMSVAEGRSDQAWTPTLGGKVQFRWTQMG